MDTVVGLVHDRQAPLRAWYAAHPEAALIHKRVRSSAPDGRDPFHGTVIPENLAHPDAAYGVAWHYGIDEAVGGLHDAPNPGELLCAALAACADGTVRLIANHLGVELEHLEVEASGTVDVRGALGDDSVKVGFEAMSVEIRLRAVPGTPVHLVDLIGTATERLCIDLDTLRRGVPVEVTVTADR